MLTCHEPSLVPMRTSNGDVITVVGSVQEVQLPGVEPFYIFRWLRTETFISQHNQRFLIEAESMGARTPRGLPTSFASEYSAAQSMHTSFHDASARKLIKKRSSSDRDRYAGRDSKWMARISEGGEAADSSSLGSDLRMLDSEHESSGDFKVHAPPSPSSRGGHVAREARPMLPAPAHVQNGRGEERKESSSMEERSAPSNDWRSRNHPVQHHVVTSQRGPVEASAASTMPESTGRFNSEGIMEQPVVQITG